MNLTINDLREKIKTYFLSERTAYHKAISDKAKKIEAEISRPIWPTSQKRSLAVMFSSILGEDLQVQTDITSGSMPLRGDIIILTTNCNQHNYEINIPVMYFGYNKTTGQSYSAMKNDGSLGNSVPTNGGWKPASNKQKESFTKNLSDKAVFKILAEEIVTL